MRMLAPLAVVATLLAAGACSSSPVFDPQQWEPTAADYTALDCGDLVPEWGTGDEEAPIACWTYRDSTEMRQRFAHLVASMSEHAGAEPTRGPSCMGTVGCLAEWENADGYVTLASGVSLVGLQNLLNSGPSADRDTQTLYELLLWTNEHQSLSDTEWNQYYDPLTF